MSTVQVKVNDELRASAEAILHSIGLTMSEGVRLFLKQLVNHDGLPFRLQRSYELKDEIKESIEAWENGDRDGFISCNSATEFSDWLRKETAE